ncbi:unnamed protein product [Rotaria sordida]|uniref:Uncharacterized protein n=1 Tax=Rotaria sordida TaxID=392033 RepID=A0A818FJD5_9BILA|nr:unnamed protein product [Rotaria sordida]CAF3589028.1 unnamed protein product [Rotaria sordida]
MNQFDEGTYLSRIRQSRNRSKYININENGKTSIQLPDDYTKKSHELRRYCRNYVRFRKSSSRSRSRNNLKFFHIHSSIDYRKKLFLLVLQIISLLHLCSIIYCHQRQLSFTVQYTIITIVLFNILTYCCVQYDTQQAEHGELLLGESSLLFLLWYGGIIGGGLALLIEKHKHLRRNINSTQLIAEHDYYDMENILKLVVWHTKIINSMRQLFPTWFNELSYRCIYCFSYDLVSKPQQFMTHVDDEQMTTIQPLDMTFI